MNFDFQQQFSDYSNIELLKIIKRPSDYQPTAVAIAKQLLNERQVTIQEEQLADQYFQDIENSKKLQKEKVDSIKNKATNFLDPVLYPSGKVEPNKWLNILLLLLALQYGWSLFLIAKRIITFFQCYNCSFDISFLAEVLTLLYIPFIFFLLLKRKRWGWILLFADNLISLISRLGQFYLFLKYQGIHQNDTTSFLWPITIKAAFIFFLWRDSIADHFNVTHEMKKKSVTITLAGILLIILTIYAAV